MGATYYQLATMQQNSPDFCYVRREPRELGLTSWKLGKGVRIGDDYPESVTLRMADEDPGMALPSFVGNTCGLLVVDSAICDAMRGRVSDAEAEFLKVSIVNHRGRVASNDYFIVNPLGVYDLLNLKESTIEYFQGKVVSVDAIVLDPAKLIGKPHLVRLREMPAIYFISAALVADIRAIQPKPTNGSLGSYPEIPAA